LALLALGSLVAVTIVAAASALWFQVLTIDASVTTDELEVQLRGLNCNDNEPDNPFQVVGWPIQTKDVGDFDVVLAEGQITITNAYPGYALDCEVEVENIGDVPVHIERWVITIDDPNTPDDPDVFMECVSTICRTFPGGPDLYDVDPTTPDDHIYAELVDSLGCQLEFEDGAAGSFIFGVRQPAAEGTTYVVELHAQFNQWNESGWDGCNDPKSQPVVPVLPLDELGTPYDPVLEGISEQP
jgi:hypothetical protein